MNAVSTMSAGRSCPLNYRYGAAAIARAPVTEARILYVIGGLYGNLEALDTIETMAQAENGPVTLCFNGDFNWFNVDEHGFQEINRRVLRHHAILGNVEAELGTDSAAADCGCAYPETVDEAIVQRSNRIHARLKAAAARFPVIVTALAALPMVARYRVGACHIGVVHGDADALAGWRFDAAALDQATNQTEQQAWLERVFAQAQVDVFASTHTCMPALRRLAHAPHPRAIINNGAAGMPNFRAEDGLFGLITRIATVPSPHQACYGTQIQNVWVDALPVRYDQAAWQQRFLQNWSAGSDAWQSYFGRISQGTQTALAAAFK